MMSDKPHDVFNRYSDDAPGDLLWCKAGIAIEGTWYPCLLVPPHHGWSHSNSEAEAVWQCGEASVPTSLAPPTDQPITKQMVDEMINERYAHGQKTTSISKTFTPPDWVRVEQGVDMKLHGIGWAVNKLREGHAVHRTGWNGKGQYLVLHQYPIDEDFLPWVSITGEGKIVPWVCSQTDLLANDWELKK